MMLNRNVTYRNLLMTWLHNPKLQFLIPKGYLIIHILSRINTVPCVRNYLFKTYSNFFSFVSVCFFFSFLSFFSFFSFLSFFSFFFFSFFLFFFFSSLEASFLFLAFKISKAFLPSPILVTCPTHLNLQDLINLTKLSKLCKLQSIILWLIFYRA